MPRPFIYCLLQLFTQEYSNSKVTKRCAGCVRALAYHTVYIPAAAAMHAHTCASRLDLSYYSHHTHHPPGALTVVTNCAVCARRVHSQLCQTVRPMWSSPPAHGAAIVALVLGDAQLRAELWKWKVSRARPPM